MIPVKQALRSSVGKKFVMAISGIALVVFLILHLVGNLLLYIPGGVEFNEYAFKLHSFGFLTYAGEIGLLALIALHAFLAISISRGNSASRPAKYAEVVSGLLLLAFIIFHVWHLRFGPAIEQGYITQVREHSSRDLYRLVFESFKNPMLVAIYTISMVFMAFHLRHGFWSAFQSLGAMRPRFSGAIYALGLVIALVLAAGFIGIPLYIYFALPGGVA
jgi:succinate dehydrogenase / fumarate reductase, cytochrome b subunit